MKVLILNGHDNYGNGGAGNDKWGTEQGLNREFSKLIKKYLIPYADVDIYNPNLDDKSMYTYLKNGGGFNFIPYAYVLELHFNAKSKSDIDGNGTMTGCGIYVHQSEIGISVEQKIIAEMNNVGMATWGDGIYRRNDLLVQNRVKGQGRSHALLEICFIDDGDDMQFYFAHKEALAEAVAKGIVEGFGLNKESSTATTNTGKTNSVNYMVKVTDPYLNIREGAGTNFAKVGQITDFGCYTIVAEANGQGADKWGKLLSGAGWVSLDYTQKI